ncbi:sensor histidine kinase [Blastococcus montanus]|uniref:sensor histidine kinase n=1 Tax=Blastococcus montanus TaxID=3144973 RepID=UPI00320A6B63
MDPSRLRPALPPWSDVVLAGAFLAVSLAQVLVEPIAGPVTSVVVAAGSTLPLAWRRTAPTAAAFAGTAIWLVPTPRGFLFLGFVVAVVLFFSVGAHARSLGRILLVTAFGATVGVAAVLSGPQDPPVAIGAVLAVTAPAAAGRLVAHVREQNARLHELTTELLRERAAAERAAIGEERSRIARELHDVIGHEVTVIALQADAAAAALAKAPERAGAPVEAIRRSAAEALAEMRRVVVMLRTAEEQDLHPQPGLDDVPALVEQSRNAGTRVHLTLEPPARPAHASVELAAYRLVQEALTNARRHAPGAPVDVRVTGDGTAVLVEVSSRPATAVPCPRESVEGTGFGLVGMRERVRMLGGRLDAGPTEAGGYLLSARLPLELPAPR